MHADAQDNESENRRNEEDRRASEDRRRSSRGLFELRARRDRISTDRRQTERRSEGRSLLTFWRRRST